MLRLETDLDTVLLSEFLDALADLREGPEVMQFLVANLSVVCVVPYMLQVAYDELGDMLILQALVEVTKHPFDRMVKMSPSRSIEAAETF
jgi:hypothetical protein